MAKRIRASARRRQAIKFNEQDLVAVKKNLSELQQRTANSVMNKSAKYAMVPVEKKIKAAVPRRTGLLAEAAAMVFKKAVTRRGITIKPTLVWVGFDSNVVGPNGEKPRKYAHLVEGGTDPHEIKLKKPLKLFGGKILPPGTVLKHPGTRATHAVKRVYASTRAMVIDRFVKKSWREIKKIKMKGTTHGR